MRQNFTVISDLLLAHITLDRNSTSENENDSYHMRIFSFIKVIQTVCDKNYGCLRLLAHIPLNNNSTSENANDSYYFWSFVPFILLQL